MNVVRCGACGQELRTYEEFSEHRRRHLLEHWWRTNPELVRMLVGCLAMRRTHEDADQL